MTKTTVALLCGLPASGKTTLAKWLLDQFREVGDETIGVSHIEYDQVEAGLLEHTTCSSHGEDAYTREIWKQSRAKSLGLIQTNLALVPPTRAARRIVLVDDNFHLRSMRREVYRICQDYVQANEESAVYFTILWLDTPPPICLERNGTRPRSVPKAVVDRMSSTLEPPGKELWEQCFLRIQNLPEETASPIWKSVVDFLTKDCFQHCNPVPPPPPPIDLQVLEEERRKTRESWLHTWDQRLRKWVGKVAQVSRKDTGQANEARKTLLVRLRQELGDHLPTSEQMARQFLEEMKVQWTASQRDEFLAAATANEDDQP